MSKFFIDRPVAAMSLAIVMVLLGVVSLGNLSIEQYPDITPPVVQIEANYPGANATIVNDAVATPIAESVMGTDDMLYMKATSANDGSMTLEATFEVGSSPDMNAILVQNNLSSALSQLPEAVAEQGVTAHKSNTGFLMVYSLSSDGRYDDAWLSNYAYINIRSELQKVNGVGKVEIMGAGKYAMRIWLEPDKMHYYGLSLDDVQSAIKAQAGLYPAGKFGAEPADDGTLFTYTVTLPEQINTAEEYERIVLRLSDEGGEVRLGDVARIELGAESYGTHSLYDDKPSALIVIYQQPGSNAVALGNAIKGVMAEVESRLPDGVEVNTVVDATTNIKAGIEDIIRTLIIALALVIVVIFLFLADWRATLIPLVAIPVSLIGSFALFPLLGFSVNIISLLGLVLAIGLVVDDAIVVVEAVAVNMERGMSSREATIEAMRKVSSPIIATTLVLLAVFIPVSLMGGISSLIFRQFSITIAIAVLLSAINALTLSPALCVLILRPQGERGGVLGRFGQMVGRVTNYYNRHTTTFVRHIGRTIVLTIVLCGVVVVMLGRLPSGFLSDEDEGFLMVFVNGAENSSLERTLDIMRDVDRIVRSERGVEATAIAAGYDMMSGVASTSCGVIFTVLEPYNSRSRSADEIAASLTQRLYSAVPEAECYAFTPPAIPGLGVTSGLTLEVLDTEGRGLKYLERYVDTLMHRLRGEPSIASVTTQYNSDIAQRHLDIDVEYARLMGVDPSEVYTMLGTYLGGSYLGTFNRFGQLYQIYLQADAPARYDARSLNRYYLRSASDEQVPLSAFVSVRDTVGVEYLSQYNLRNAIELTLVPAQDASTGDVMALAEGVARDVLPDDIVVEWSGMAYQQSRASQSAMWGYAIAILFVFLVLAALYNSWSLPLAILLSIPAALAGAVVAVSIVHHFVPYYINNIYLQIALIMLIALAAKNSILVTEYADAKFRNGESLLDSACGAAAERVRPIVMTALAFVFGVLPMVFASGAYSTARHILGLSLVGGMLVATLLGVFIYPAAYYLVGRVMGFERRRADNNKLVVR